MARYIDADKAKELFKTDHPIGIAMRTIFDELPTADVVPKSEVDEIAEELSDTIVMKDELFDEVVKLRKELSEAKAEVAREIMREVRQTLLNMVLANAMGKNYDIEKCFNEIEKKYTEGAKNE